MPEFMYRLALSAQDAGIPAVDVNNGTLTNVINTTYFVIGSITVLFVIIGGIRYMISAGDAGGIKRAKDTILYALIGLVLTVAAFGITQLVIYVVSG